MEPILYKYLSLYKKLDIPGIGNFFVEDTSPSLQFTDKQWLPPQSRIKFAPVVHPTNNHFYSFLSREWGVDKVVAIRRYKEEIEQVMDELKHHGMYDWKEIGVLRKTGDGSFAFSAAEPSQTFFSVLPAERVMRKYTQHTVLVGEQEQVKDYVLPDATNEELITEEPATDRWKLYAWILAIVAVVLIVVYYLFIM